MHTKCGIYNLALGALLLTKRISDIEVDTSIEKRVLDTHWDTALQTAAQDMDLDAIAISRFALTLYQTQPTIDWKFAYNYPQNCLLLRRLLRHDCQSDNYQYWRTRPRKDTRSNQVPRQVGNLNGLKVIFTNCETADAEYIPSDFSLTMLSAPAGLAVAYKLAQLAAPLISGKGAGPLRKEIQATYILVKAEAQQLDRIENATFEDDREMSEFVAARLS